MWWHSAMGTARLLWHRWDLVTILPGAVFGPPLSSRKSGESVGMLQARITHHICRVALPLTFSRRSAVKADDMTSGKLCLRA